MGGCGPLQPAGCGVRTSMSLPTCAMSALPPYVQSTVMGSGQEASSPWPRSALGLGKGHASEADVQHPMGVRWATVCTCV